MNLCGIGNRMVQGILLGLVLLMLAATAQASTATMVSDEDLIVSSRAILQGKVIGIESRFDDQKQIYTYVTISVKRVFKGEIKTEEVVLRQPGGQVGNYIQKIYGASDFKVGE